MRIERVEGVPADGWQVVGALSQRIAGFDAAALAEQLVGRRRLMSCLAWIDGELAGYKIGFEERPRYFESWQGGVAPEHRRRGVASALMDAQHAWCREQGFMIVSTITEGSNRPMLIANLRAGFEVCGTFLDRRKIVKVILQKHLD